MRLGRFKGGHGLILLHPEYGWKRALQSFSAGAHLLLLIAPRHKEKHICIKAARQERTRSRRYALLCHKKIFPCIWDSSRHAPTDKLVAFFQGARSVYLMFRRRESTTQPAAIISGRLVEVKVIKAFRVHPHASAPMHISIVRS